MGGKFESGPWNPGNITVPYSTSLAHCALIKLWTEYVWIALILSFISFFENRKSDKYWRFYCLKCRLSQLYSTEKGGCALIRECALIRSNTILTIEYILPLYVNEWVTWSITQKSQKILNHNQEYLLTFDFDFDIIINFGVFGVVWEMKSFQDASLCSL